MYGICFFFKYIFWEASEIFSFFASILPIFLKTAILSPIPYYPLVSPYFTPLSKVCGVKFNPYFWMFFFRFLENHFAKSEILGSLERTGCVKLFCLCGQFFYSKSCPSEKSKFWFFDRFLKLFSNLPHKSEVLG